MYSKLLFWITKVKQIRHVKCDLRHKRLALTQSCYFNASINHAETSFDVGECASLHANTCSWQRVAYRIYLSVLL